MNFLKNKWRQFCVYLDDNKKNIIRNYLIFIGICTILLIIDLVCKQMLFEPNNLYDETAHIEYQNWLFGIRSVKNSGLTFIPSVTAESILLTFFNFLIMLACLIFILFLRSYWFAIFIGFIFSGALGNTIDRLAFGYVRDIVFLPWCDKGTFNFADTDVVVGCIGIIITMICHYLIVSRK